MLLSVSIRNYALVDALEINFAAGLNVITGETGAGKSILIGAIGALLGDRVSPRLVRQGRGKAIVEGEFDVSAQPWVCKILEKHGYADNDDILIIRREIAENGRSRAFLNDTPATLDHVGAIAERLVDLHGQHEHQSLLNASEHLEFLDAFASLTTQREQVGASYHHAEGLRKKLDELRSNQAALLEKKEFLAFQLAELDKINPQPGEEEDLAAEERKLAASSDLRNLAQQIIELLYESDHAAASQIATANAMLQDLEALDPEMSEMGKDVNAALISIEETSRTLQRYMAQIEDNPERLEQLRQRLSEFAFLKKKHAGDMQHVLERQQNMRAELERVENLDTELEQSQQAWQQAVAAYRELALNLSRQRHAAAEALQQRVPEMLAQLGMANARFAVNIQFDRIENGWVQHEQETLRAWEHGLDKVAFEIAANPGSALQPLARVASGGEISRIMLALKSLIAHSVRIPVLIFDEIDNGISGRIAHTVGQNLRQLSASHQILCITHLPQIASAGNIQFLVEKSAQNGESYTSIKKLSDEERQMAIAQLLGGISVSSTHLESARELLRQSS